ncbi:MAG: hypothetical protein Q8L39_04795 [Burkholderiales bacterium]|nr:hypothetical protein [Burkholderiales bacterium]
MKNRERGFIDRDAFMGMFIGLIVIGIAIGGLLFLGVPWLWHLLKPWIHTVTG